MDLGAAKPGAPRNVVGGAGLRRGCLAFGAVAWRWERRWVAQLAGGVAEEEMVGETAHAPCPGCHRGFMDLLSARTRTGDRRGAVRGRGPGVRPLRGKMGPGSPRRA